MSKPISMVGLLLNSIQISRFGLKKHAAIINRQLNNSSGEFVEKLLMFNKSFVSSFSVVIYQQTRGVLVTGSITHISHYMAIVEMESIFNKQEHTCALKAVTGLAFATVFSDMWSKEMYALVYMRSKRGK